MRPALFLIGIMAVLLVASGCVMGDRHESPGIPVPTVLSAQSRDNQNITPTAAAGAGSIPRYVPGDIIDFSPVVKKTPHLIILDYNNLSGHYLVDRIFENSNESWGYRIYPEPWWLARDATEKGEPYLIAHISLSAYDTWYPSKEGFESGSPRGPPLLNSPTGIPMADNQSAFIAIDPIGNHTVGDAFTITGTTSLKAGDELFVEIYPPANMMGPHGMNLSGTAGKEYIDPGTGGKNTWLFEVDTSDFIPERYEVVVTSFTSAESAEEFFNLSQKM